MQPGAATLQTRSPTKGLMDDISAAAVGPVGIPGILISKSIEVLV